MNDETVDLKHRTKAFAARIIRWYSALPQTTEAKVAGKRHSRFGTSGGAHYREAPRDRSDAELRDSLLRTTGELTAILATVPENVKRRKSTDNPEDSK